MLEKNYGHVVAMSSFCGILGLANAVPYCASKFAVRGKLMCQKIKRFFSKRSKISQIIKEIKGWFSATYLISYAMQVGNTYKTYLISTTVLDNMQVHGCSKHVFRGHHRRKQKASMESNVARCNIAFCRHQSIRSNVALLMLG